MAYSLPCCEHVDHLPPSYSAVMAEKELSPWNINVKKKRIISKDYDFYSNLVFRNSKQIMKHKR